MLMSYNNWIRWNQKKVFHSY